MPALKTYDLFIAHAWTYNDEYYRLVNMLKDAPYFSWRNFSVPEHDRLPGGNTLRSQLLSQIRPVNAVLILAGMYVHCRGDSSTFDLGKLLHAQGTRHRHQLLPKL